MSEKKGFTGQLYYDFNTAACLEVQLNNNWYRVTGREFRSFNLPRRISEMIEDKYITKEYEGPVYLFMTNTKVKEKDLKPGLMCPNDIDPRTELSIRMSKRGK